MESEKLRNYLLGNLAENEAETIDLRVIEDAEFAAELHLAENDLMEDFLEETLSDAEKELFWRNFLISEERQKHLAHLNLLRNYAKNTVLKEAPIKPEADNFFRRLKNSIMLNLRPAVAALALVIAVLAVAAIWLLFLNGSASPVEKDFVELNKNDLTDVTNFKDLPNLSLAEGTLRDTSNPKKLSAGDIRENVLLRLALPLNFTAETDFNVKISKTGGDTVSLARIRSYKNPSGTEVRLLVPAAFFSKGEYKIEVRPAGKDESPMIYTFTVE